VTTEVNLCPICKKPPLQCGCDDYPEKPDSDYCRYCGKDRYDFSDLGCSACDARHPNFGVMP
jgi:hypothetical protein